MRVGLHRFLVETCQGFDSGNYNKGELVKYTQRIRDVLDSITIMRNFSIQFHLNIIRIGVLFLMLSLLGCSPAPTPPSEITPGSSKEDVTAVYGEPDRTQEFTIPDEPFFGPQEGLIDLVPLGTVVEEWVYEIGEEELYIWFTGDNNATREQWRVLDLGKYPKGAVY
jgi:hypothetical protein